MICIRIFLLLLSTFINLSGKAFGDAHLGASIGRCPKMSPMPNFEPPKYEGKWYVLEVWNSRFILMWDCNYIDYKHFRAEDGAFEADYFYKFRGTMDTHVPVKGSLVPCENNGGNLVADMCFYYQDESINSRGRPEMPCQSWDWLVLDTDYETYTLEYVCWDDPTHLAAYKPSMWLMSREKFYLPGAKEKMYGALQKLGFDPDQLLQVDHTTNCTDV